jgi:hypothetical protein
LKGRSNVPSTSYVPLLPLLLELLRWQHQQDDQDQKETEARMEAFQQAVSKRREELRAEYLQAARARGTEITEKEEREIEDRAAQEAAGQITRERAGTLLVPDRPRTPWEAALSHLFPAMTVPLTDGHDPREKLAREYCLPGEPTRDESALREYLVKFRLGGVEETSLLSAELARLDGEGFGNRLAESLWQEFPEEVQEIVGALSKAIAGTSKRRRGRKSHCALQDREMAADWKRARGAGVLKKDFARGRKLSLRELNRILNRHAKQEKRARK